MGTTRPQTDTDALITRIVRSKVFSQHENSCKLLQYLAKQPGPVSEKTIAMELFGRGNDFVPRDDSTVRNHKKVLVQDLKLYFLDEGKKEPIVVDVSVGDGYGLSISDRQPTLEEVREHAKTQVQEASTLASQRIAALTEDFEKRLSATETRMREEANAQLNEALQKIQELEEQIQAAKLHPIVAHDKEKWRPLAKRLFHLGIASLFAVALIYVFHLRSCLNRLHPMNVRKMPSVERLWYAFIDTEVPPQLLFSNGKFKGDLDKPIAGVIEDREPGVAGIQTLDSITGVGEVFGVVRLEGLFSSFDREINVKRPLNFSREDANLIILGGTAENPLLERFRPDTTTRGRASQSGIKTTKYFQFCRREDNDQEGRTLCRTESGKLRLVDISSGPDDWEHWHEFLASNNPVGASYSKVLREDYFLIAFVPQDDFPNRSTMLLAGLGTWGTEAAAEFASNEDAVTMLFDALHLDKGGVKLPFFEAVVWVGISDGAPRSNYVIKAVKTWSAAERITPDSNSR